MEHGHKMTNQKLIDAIALFDKDVFANSPNQLRLIIDAARENEQLRKERDELHARLDANTKLMNDTADMLNAKSAEIQGAFEIMQAKLDKANTACKSYHTALGQRDARIAMLQAIIESRGM